MIKDFRLAADTIVTADQLRAAGFTDTGVTYGTTNPLRFYGNGNNRLLLNSAEQGFRVRASYRL